MAATNLISGDVGVIGYNVGGSDSQGTTVDSIQIVLLKPVGSGTVIYLTDRTWNGSSFAVSGSDGTTTYTFGSDMAAGTVINIPINGGFDLETGGESVYIYQGTSANAPTSFLFAIDYGDGNSTFNGSLVNTGLIVGQNAVAVRYDTGAYHGPTTDAFAQMFNNGTLLQNIVDNTNWNGDDTAGQVANDQLEQNGPYNLAPDLSFWLAAGGGGNGIVSTHVDAGSTGQNIAIRYVNDQGDPVQTFANPRDISFDTAEGKFFVIDSNANGGTNRILQGNIADLIGNPANSPTLTMTVLYTSDQAPGVEAQIRDLQIDTINNIIYYTEGQRLEKIGYNTANQTGVVLAQIGGTGSGNPNGSTNGGFVDDFVINFATGDIYLTVHRVVAAQDGDSVTRNFLYKISGLTSASGANFATWANGKITTMPFSPDDDDQIDGGLDISGEAFPREKGTLEGVALSPDGNTLYFTTASILFDHDGDGGFSGPGGFGTPPQLKMGGVYSYALTSNPNGVYTQIFQQVDDGDTNSQAITASGPQGLLDDIEVDPVTGQLYFLDLTGDQLVISGVSQNPPGDEGIWRINTNGSGLTFVQAIYNLDGLGAGSLYMNRAPTVSSHSEATPGVTEASLALNSGATALVQPFLSADVSDIETASNSTQQLNGAVVWVSNNFLSGTTHQDTLTINGQTSGTLGSGISFSYNSNSGGLVLTGTNTFNNYEAAIALVRFNTSGDNPTNYGYAPTRTISWSVSDGLDHSDAVSTTISVTGINDAPVNSVGAAMNFTEDTTGTAGNAVPPPAPVNAITGISVFDVDADPAAQNITVTLSVNVGSISIRTDVTGGITSGMIVGGANGTGSVTIIATQNQINATLAATNNSAAANGLVYTPPANFNGAASLTVTTNDNGRNGTDPGQTGTGTTEADTDVKTLNVADVNDAPTVGGDGSEDSPTILEDTPYTDANAPTVGTLFGPQFSDALDVQANGGNPTGSTGDSLAGIAITANGSNGNGTWQYWDGSAWTAIGAASLGAAKTLSATTLIRFSPTLNYNGAAPTLTARLIESGGPAITNGGTVDLSSGSATGGTTVYSTNAVVLSQAITAVNDAPVNTVGSAVNINEDATNVALTGISIADVDAGGSTMTVTLSVAHGTLTLKTDVSGGVGTTDVSGNGSGSLVVTGTLAAINATLAAANGLLYNPTTNYNGSDELTIVTDDGGATGQDPGATGTGTSEADTDVKAITIASVNDAPVVTTSAGQTAYAEDGAAAAIDASLTLSDVDHATLVSGTVSITGNYESTDVLSFTPDAGYGNIAVSSYTNGVLTLTSAGGTATVQEWEAALRSVTYSTTSDTPGTGTRTISYAVSDGTDGSNVGTKEVTVAATNDGPDAEGPATDQTGTEDTDLVFRAADGNALSVADPDATSVKVTLAVAHGTLTLSGIGGLTFTAGDGSGDGTMTFSGTVAAVNAALEGLIYRGNLNYEGTDQLDFDVSDEGSAGSGGTLTESYSVGITLADDGIINGSSGDDGLIGTGGNDLFYLQDGGDDQVDGVGGADGFYFGGALTADDEVDGGPQKDQLAIQGDYSALLVLGDKNLVNVETLVFLSGTDTRFGDSGTHSYDYNIKTVEANVAALQTLTVNWSGLQAGEDVIFDGRAETNGKFLTYGGAGADTVYGGQLNDGFYFGEGLFSVTSDHIDGAGGADDQLGLRGDYTLVFAETTIVNVETIALLSGKDTRFGPLGPDYTYNITTHNGNVALGEQLTINGSALRSGETLTFNGANETDGHFRIFGGAGNDSLTGGGQSDMIYGGLGQDTLLGGGGNDSFVYRTTAESTAASQDWIKDFTSGGDKIDLSQIDANTLAGGNQAFHWIGSGAFAGTNAASAGELRAYLSGGEWFVEGDTNGDGTADFVLHVTTVGAQPLVQGDFIP